MTWGDGIHRENEYFRNKDRELLKEARRKSEQEAAFTSLMEASGIREPALIRELEAAGLTAETARLLHLVPLVQVAWADGGVSEKEKEQILQLARLRGVKRGSPAHDCLLGWLTEAPTERFFRAALRGIRAILEARPAVEADSLHSELLWYCNRVASASGGFLGLGSRVSHEEERLLSQFTAELAARHPAAAKRATAAFDR